MKVLPFNASAAIQFDALKKAKINIGAQDLKIAAIALANNATVLTRNIRHFEKIPELKFEDWTCKVFKLGSNTFPLKRQRTLPINFQ